MKKAPAISVTEWLDELARLSNRSDEGLSSVEWAEQIGLSQKHALVKLKEAQRAGWLKVGRRRSITMDGRPCLIPVYQIVKPKAGKTVPKSSKP